MLWEEKELQEENEEVPCRYRRLSKSMEFLDNALSSISFNTQVLRLSNPEIERLDKRSSKPSQSAARRPRRILSI